MMTSKRTKRIIKINYGIAASLIMIGAIFKVQHWPYGQRIQIIGFFLGGVTLVFEKFILKE
ncbi:MAG: GldL-related protein [Lutibacter sp.]